MKLSEEGQEIARRLGEELDREHVSLLHRLVSEVASTRAGDWLGAVTILTEAMTVVWDTADLSDRRMKR
jgi:hypothetical protein